MQRTTNKYLASLLALLLVLAPLQGVMAVVGAGDGESMHNATSDVAMGSQPCEMANCCKGKGCVLGHCITCVIALFSGFYNMYLPVTHETYVSRFGTHFPQQLIIPLFRPPIA